jgi:hypothetical protein
VLTALGAAALGCAGDTETEATAATAGDPDAGESSGGRKGGKGGKAGKAGRGSGSGSQGAGSAEDREAEGIGKGGAPVDPLKGLSKAQICADTGLSLVKWDFHELQRNFQGLCCGSGGLSQDEALCSLDWPWNDVPACEEYDRLRNTVYARYGYPFEKEEWKREFEDESWYHRRDDFSESWLSAPAKRNIEELKSLKAKKAGCAP